MEELERNWPWRLSHRHLHKITHHWHPTHTHTHRVWPYILKFAMCLFESVFMSFITLWKNCEIILLKALSEWMEVVQKHFVHLQPLVLSDTLALYHHLADWLMEHALQIRAELAGYSLPDKALTQGSTCVFLRVCWQVRDCSRARRDAVLAKADWYNNTALLSKTTTLG